MEGIGGIGLAGLALTCTVAWAHPGPGIVLDKDGVIYVAGGPRNRIFAIRLKPIQLDLLEPLQVRVIAQSTADHSIAAQAAWASEGWDSEGHTITLVSGEPVDSTARNALKSAAFAGWTCAISCAAIYLALVPKMVMPRLSAMRHMLSA